ncbi:two pore domain potassium channel family protein [Bacillus idriensis]|uniref:Two pore domain potassium channel family protein n=2 Tax=Metabacillus idriensis TaxID=324768 RepID=A0A6I2MC77_9BACI|nr:two pore domain potassium channel family protein [Metabacillus idriensis]
MGCTYMGGLFALAVSLCLLMSFNIFIRTFKERNFLSIDTLLIVIFLYLSILIGFSMIFLILDSGGFEVLVDNGVIMEGSYLERLHTCLYFSAVTLFSLGYGDVIPIGFGRLLAVLEALIGYVLPAVFVARTVWGLDKGL